MPWFNPVSPPTRRRPRQGSARPQAHVFLAVAEPCVHSTRQDSSTALEMHRTTPSLPPHPSTHLEPVHQLQGLAVVLVGFEDDIGQFVDDDVQGALLLDWPAKVQLQAGDTEKKNNFSSWARCPVYPVPSARPRGTARGQEGAGTRGTGRDKWGELTEGLEPFRGRPCAYTSVPEPQAARDTENTHVESG